jgi:hypothetical protein
MTQLADEAIRPPDPITSRRLFQVGAAGLAVWAGWLTFRSDLQDSILITLGVAGMVLGALPALNWARKAEVHFPVFEIFMLTSVPFYAVPLLGGHPGTLQFTDAATMKAAAALLLFQSCAIVTFVATKAQPVKSRALVVSLLPEAALRYSHAGIWLNTLYLYVIGFTNLIPGEYVTLTRAAFFGIGTVSLFVQMRRWGAGKLVQSEKFIVGFLIGVQTVFLFRDLYLIVGVSVLLLALIGYISTSRRIPVAVLFIVLPLISVLHNGKSAMRTEYWEARRPMPDLVNLPEYFTRWVELGIKPPENDSDAPTSMAGRLFERASLFQMLCLVTENTPESRPYLNGESYRYVPVQLVPSILWPDKPSSLLSNILLAVHYQLVASDNQTSVSIAFGMLAESFANFGLLGCALLGVLLGYGYKRISLAGVGQPQFSALGLLTILLAAWSFQVEQVFATWCVSLIQGAVVVIGGPMVFRVLFKAD